MGSITRGYSCGLTIIIVPGTLAEGFIEQGRKFSAEKINHSPSDQPIPDTSHGDANRGSGASSEQLSNVEKIAEYLSEQSADDNPDRRNWFEDGQVEIRRSTDIFSSGTDIRKNLRAIHSIVDAIAFLRLRANTGNENYTVETIHVPWASDKEIAKHEMADNKYLVGGGGSVASRNHGRDELSRAIDKCEKEKRKYIIIGHSHGGSVGVKALRWRAAKKKKLNGFLGSIYIGAPVLSTRARLFNIVPINNVMSPTIGQFFRIGAIIAAVLIARLVGLVLVSESFTLQPNDLSTLQWLWLEAQYSTLIAGWFSALLLIAFAGAWLVQWRMDAKAKVVDGILAEKSPQYFVSSPHDEIVNIYNNLRDGLFDEVNEKIRKTADEGHERHKDKVKIGIAIWWSISAVRKFAVKTFQLTLVIALLWVFLTLGGPMDFITDAATKLGIEPNNENSIRDTLTIFFGDKVWMSPPTIFVLLATLAFAGWRAWQNLERIRSKLHENFERIVTIGLLGLQENRLPRNDELKGEPQNLIINEEPKEVFAMVTKLANSRGANMTSMIRDIIFNGDAAQKIRSPELLAMLRKLPATTGLVHTSYFRSKIFMVYLAKLVAELSDGHLTFPRNNAKPDSNHVHLNTVAKQARLIDLERIMIDAATTAYDVEFENDRRIERPDAGSWAD
jgi:hypothetical protein